MGNGILAPRQVIEQLCDFYFHRGLSICLALELDRSCQSAQAGGIRNFEHDWLRFSFEQSTVCEGQKFTDLDDRLDPFCGTTTVGPTT